MSLPMRKAMITVAAATLIGCTNSSNEQSLPHMEAVSFPAKGEALFIQARAWGLAGNHEQILIRTDSANRAYDQELDYAFVTDEVYYRYTADTLYIYAPSDQMMPPPARWKSQVTISCNGLLGYDKVMDYRQNYARYGLTRVSVHAR